VQVELEFSVTNELFTPEAVRARLVAVPGAHNMRDLGGYPTADGRFVRSDLLFRSGHPGDILAEHLPDLLALGLRTIIDLRTTGERRARAFPDALIASLTYWSRDYDFSRGEIVKMLSDPTLTASNMRERIFASYSRYPEEQRDAIGAVFKAILAGRFPLLINCTAGKDRTGVISAILLSALGVPREIVREDYALTEKINYPTTLLHRLEPDNPYAAVEHVDLEVRRAMMRSAPEYLDAMFETLDAVYGSIPAYLESEHGIGDDQLTSIRELLLERRTD